MKATAPGFKPPPHLFVLLLFILSCSNRERLRPARWSRWRCSEKKKKKDKPELITDV